MPRAACPRAATPSPGGGRGPHSEAGVNASYFPKLFWVGIPGPQPQQHLEEAGEGAEEAENDPSPPPG